MFYKSTRNSGVSISSAEAIVQGISADGGLFVPSEIPQMSMDEIVKLGDMSYAERAAVVFSKFLTDFTDAELKYCTESAYNDKNFASADIAEISHLLTVHMFLSCGTAPPAHSRIWLSRSFLIFSLHLSRR